MQPISDELIERFFKGISTPEESAAVLAFLKDHPEHPYLLNEWAAADSKTPLPAKEALEMYDNVVATLGKGERQQLRILRRVAVAAAVTVVLMVSWLLVVKHNSSTAIAKSEPAAQIEWILRQNTGDTAITLALADSSKITLWPGASVRAQNNFGQAAKRELYLQGQALFKVAKNKEKPFIVYSGFISTTALGTAFLVTENNNGIRVKLTEGKIVVAVTDTNYKKIHRDYYLVPGEEIVFAARDRAGIIHKGGGNTMNAAGRTKNTSTVDDTAGASYMFNNQTLAEVLDQLSAIYKVKIDYSRADIKKIYFIGRFERNDSVEKTIRDIALLNKLSVKKQNGGFILERKKH